MSLVRTNDMVAQADSIYRNGRTSPVPGLSSIPAAQTSATCLPSQISASNGPQVGGASGERSLSIILTNQGTTPCILDGYPHVRLLSSAGAVLPLPQVARSQYLTIAGPRPVMLRVGANAYVVIAKYRCDLRDLRVAAWVQLSLPGAGSSRVFTIAMKNALGSLNLCMGGPHDPGNVIAVTPVESSLAATAP